jgi:hypothetical protein
MEIAGRRCSRATSAIVILALSLGCWWLLLHWTIGL